MCFSNKKGCKTYMVYTKLDVYKSKAHRLKLNSMVCCIFRMNDTSKWASNCSVHYKVNFIYAESFASCLIPVYIEIYLIMFVYLLHFFIRKRLLALSDKDFPLKLAFLYYFHTAKTMPLNIFEPNYY